MTKDVILAIVRHCLNALGAVVGAKGVIASDDIEAATGAVIALVAVIWSILDKRRRAAAPAPDH